MEKKVEIDPSLLLDALRGDGKTCGCGKKLIQVLPKDGMHGYVQHETYEDEDHHYAFFGGGASVKIAD